VLALTNSLRQSTSRESRPASKQNLMKTTEDAEDTEESFSKILCVPCVLCGFHLSAPTICSTLTSTVLFNCPHAAKISRPRGLRTNAGIPADIRIL
jgi:hypothetical protein